MQFKSYTTTKGETLLYTGSPDVNLFERLADGEGDVWHSSYDQGFKNCFSDLVYQTTVFWWFLNDIEGHNQCINWRVNVDNFVVRKSVWESLQDLDHNYVSRTMKGLDLGFNLLRNQGGIPLYIKDLFTIKDQAVEVPDVDRYYFFLKHFKKQHSLYMMLRKGIFNFPREFSAYKKAKNKLISRNQSLIPLKKLQAVSGSPTVSLVIPTMKRQQFTELVLNDHNAQTYLIKEAVIVDATPEGERDDKYYNPKNFKFDVKVKWQTTKGSCNARNEAIKMCTGDYIIFADDDVRVFPDFVENHLRLLQTYNANACNGLDIMAQSPDEDLSDLRHKLEQLGESRWKVGVSHMFSNANSCVKRDLVNKLVGNDINFDGGYGEDQDFGFRILKQGETLLHNPYSPNLHLKPPQGGYRFWGMQSKKLGKERKSQPWELGQPVKMIRPVPSPTMSYFYLKHFEKEQLIEWRKKYFFLYLFKGKPITFLVRLVKMPFRILQFKKSLWYAKRLNQLGPRNS